MRKIRAAYPLWEPVLSPSLRLTLAPLGAYMKAYKIRTKGFDGFGIYLAKSAGKAKTIAMCSLGEVYRDANYSWFTSCRRAPEFDYLAAKGPGCVAWRDGQECWQIDRIPSHWYGSEPAPNIACSRQGERFR